MNLKKIQFETDEFSYFRSDYIPNLIIKFAIEQGLTVQDDGTLFLTDFMLDRFYLAMQEAFVAFLRAWYVMPPHKHMSRNPGSFERFVFLGKKYVVNYRTDPNGIIAYSFNYLLNWVKRLIETRAL